MEYKQSIIVLLASMVFFCTCSTLDETLQGELDESKIIVDSTNTAGLLLGVYNSLEEAFTSHFSIFPLQELCTDEAIAPTRATDWDDNGVWRVLHQQKWDSNNEKIRECFNTLNGISYAATDILRYKPKPQEVAATRFIRAWVMYLILDMYDQVPYRDPGESLIVPARVRTGMDALNYIMSELNDVRNILPPGPIYQANKFAADVLLMKCYLNKAVYESRSAPVFRINDMNKVIELADGILQSNTFTLSDNYFDNFSPENSASGKENIFTLLNNAGNTSNNYLFLSWLLVVHYNSFFGQGWTGANGWATLSDFYNKFEVSDKRRGVAYSSVGAPPNAGNRINVGFLIGQQYNLVDDEPLQDRFGAPLIFTPEVKNIELGANLEVTGIRPIKYFPDFPNYFSPDNDFVFFRLSDVLLMKAEAILRGGTGTLVGPYPGTALGLVNYLRTHPSRWASALTALTENILLDERGRELWWEGWRRQDMIRFGKFLLPFQEKEYLSDKKYLIYPIPDEQLAVNPNLIQNPGY
ncbi:MAG: RagB/SusD family nutrient uptake outer membrane protein [Saprospiraceae bacterium]|nr:RagB/SusD family nutrient uptake outer membrane protein [Saprospiraceae bacterium]MBK7606095.1 RagB/SusD family nutrient uptake outer membrane protein [Saprospiraceae bacterium]MBP7802699.1 RagB/SusD family nutrient uptake outer membrane protein [Saprospiraceae bacterium]MBP8094616.1 RagB/SusD family nutrient uptake outer membrane protein [Saprospiraceae bacterium]